MGGKRSHFFVPTHYKYMLDNDAAGDKNYIERPLDDLQQQIDQLGDADVKVIPISRLSDVLDKLNITYQQQVMPTKTQRVTPTKTQMVIAASLLLMLVGVVSWILQPPPIPVPTASSLADTNSDTEKKIAALEAKYIEMKDDLEGMHSLGDDKAQYQLGLKYLKGEKNYP